ncbi:hypothetical protein C8R47DRAFT_1230423 [Mycena vitilis]|nr:hypothetical protein C8R47DRAFT_1230423 [Mycena vitilis]
MSSCSSIPDPAPASVAAPAHFCLFCGKHTHFLLQCDEFLDLTGKKPKKKKGAAAPHHYASHADITLHSSLALDDRWTADSADKAQFNPRSVTITPPQKANKKSKAVVAKPVLHPSYTPAQVKALWAPLICPPVQALLPLLTTGAVARRSSAQLQSLFVGAEQVMLCRRFRKDTETGPIEIEAFLLSVWVAFPTLYNLVPNDRVRRAEIETFVPSLPDSSFNLPEIPAHLQFTSSDDEPEAPPPTKKACYQSPSVVPDTPPLQPSSRPKPKPTGKAATLASRRHHVSESVSPEVKEAPRPKKNTHHFDQAADLEAYARHTHETGYVSDGFDAAVEVYPRLIDHPQGGVLAPHVAVEKVPTAVVHDATIVPEGHMTFYISMSSQSNPATLTLKLERDTSPFTPRSPPPFTPRSPQNYPVKLDSDSNSEDKNFLIELREAEEELELATPAVRRR